MLKDFRDFVLRGNVIDLAVGLSVGVAFVAVVNAFVTNLIMAPIAAIFGTPDFSALTLGPFKYGAFITAVVQFLIVATVIFFFIVRPMESVMKRFGMAKEPVPMRDCPFCLQPVPAAATRCMYCTEHLDAEADT